MGRITLPTLAVGVALIAGSRTPVVRVSRYLSGDSEEDWLSCQFFLHGFLVQVFDGP